MILEAKNIQFSYTAGGAPAIDDLSFRLQQGEFVCLIGPSGCGKTTLLHILAGLLRQKSGSIIMNGEEIQDVAAEDRNIVMVFQQDLLFPFLNVWQNIGFGLMLRKTPEQKIKEEVQQMLELIQLPDIAQKMPRQLSSGQRQRVSLARSLILKPKVLLLDEPFTNLDPGLQQSMRELLLVIKNNFDITVICVTHSHEDVLLLSDYIGFISKGRLLQYGREFELFEKPNTTEIATFFGNSNFIPGVYRDGHVDCGFAKIPHQKEWPDCKEGQELVLTCRPEHLGIQLQDIEGDANCLKLAATVEQRVYSPAGIRYRLLVGSTVWNCIEDSHKTLEDAIHVGTTLHIIIPQQYLWLIAVS